MARSPSRQELFLSVGGTVTPLQGALKVGKTALIEFSGDAEKAFEAVERSMRDMVKDPGATAKQLTQSYSNAFREIRANAQNVLGADSGAGALNVLNASAAREAAAAAEQRAAAIRVVAEAARAEAIAQGSANAQLTAYASAATVAEREAEQYAIALRTQANTLTAVEGRMNAIVAPGKRIVEVSGQARAGMQQLSYQLGDVATQLAAGTPPTIVFAQQIGQVTQAIGLMTQETKGFIGFIGGPYGLALSSALVLLTPLVSKLFEKSKAEKEAEEAAKDHAKAIEALISAQDRAVQSTAAKLRQDYIALGVERQAAIAAREKTAALLDQAKAQLRLADATANNPGAFGSADEQLAAQRDVATAQGKVAKVEAELAKNSAALAKLNGAVDRAAGRIVADRVQARSTPEGRINVKFDEREEAARLEAERTKDYAKYGRTLAQLDVERQKELKQLQEANRQKKGTTATSDGVKIAPSEVGAMLKAAFGGTVTSTTGGKHEKGSLHYKGQAVDYVPAGGMGSVTKTQVRAALEAQGVDVLKVLGPGDKDHDDHFHVSFKKIRASRESIEKKQEALRQRELAEDVSFVDELRAARGRLLDAQGKTAVSEEERARFLTEEIDAEASGRARKIGLQLSAGKLEEAEAAQLLELNEQTRQARRIGIARQQLADQAEKQLADVRAEVDQSNELLRSQLQIADSRDDRARIERQLLENAYRLEINEAAIELASAFAAKDWDRYAKAMARAADLAERKGNDEKALERQNEGSYDRYRRELGSIDSIQDQIDDLKVDSIRRLGDELSGAAVKALGLKGALGDVVGQLIRIGLERAVLGPVADFLFGTAGGGTGGLLGGLLKSVLGFSDGGYVSGPGGPREDSIIARLSNGEFVMNADATRKNLPLLMAMNDNRLPAFADGGLVGTLPSSVARLPANDTLRLVGGNAGNGEQLVRLQVTLSDDLDARIDNRAAGVAVEVTRAAAPAIKQSAMNDTFAALGRPSL
ncbi:hypothetical protein M9978_02320 [Sphingomonas sp. MG17]|uniref:Uncharacterized protein n=1 Tax=Sphingomonas tagetis TaxID=2949092 RepID=A0A9X2KKE1_9SPHN|nr:hypothetical protein [Sphingomonas tagetis]MCP3729251.1 hypothetical protein [Sphingomonas tagetis]